jgi:2-oxoglutarate ferredoxin oxidoreductase subunit gamma
MQSEVTLAGFGGQGVLTAGKFLAQGALEKGYEVAWIPSYGPEMRGGTAYCTVVISDKPVGSPIVNNPGIVVAMNRPSLDKFAPVVKTGGVLIINSSLIDVMSGRTDIMQVKVPCDDISIQVIGSGRSANIAALGALVGATTMIPIEQIEAVMKEKFGNKPKIYESNIAIVRKGYEMGLAGRLEYQNSQK